MIYTVQTFKNEKDQRIDAYADSAQPFPSYTKFQGFAQDMFEVQPKVKQMIPYNFPIEATSIVEAFEKYEAARQLAGRQMQGRFEMMATRAALTRPAAPF